MCGERILAFMRAEQIDTRFVQQTANKPTDMTFIMISSDGRNTTIYDDEYYPSPSLESIAVTIEKGDVLISDFGIESSVIAAFFRHGRRMGAVNVFNAAPARPVVPDLVNLADIIVVNRFELSAYAGRVLIDFLDPAELRYAVESFATARQAVIVTFGARGAAVFSDGQVSWIDAISVLPIDTTGASDAFVGALGAALATSSTLAYAVRFANVAAGISVTRRGGAPSMPFRSETEAGLRASS
jgi:ribokinase